MSEVIRFNPALGLYRWRFESAPGVANEAGRWHDLNNFKGEKIGANSLLVPRTALSRGGMRPQSLIGKLEPGGDTEFDAFQPRQEWPFWALLLHGYDVPGGPLAGETAAYRHKIHRLGASAFPDTAEIRLDRNTGQITRYREVRGGGVQLKLAGKQLVSTMYTTVVGRFDYWGDAIQTGTGTATPELRGVNAINNPAPGSTPLDFYMKVTAQTSTTVTVTTKRGVSATYGAPYVIPRSSPAAPVWWLVLDENGVAMGQFTGIATEVYLPASGTFVVNDEFHWPAVCPDWTTGSPTWPYAPPPMIAVNEVLSSYAVAGGQILNFDTADLTIKSGAETKHEFGGRMPSRTREWGFQTVDGKIAREEQPGFSFQPYLVEGVPFDIVINLSSGVRLGTSGLYDYNGVLTMKNVVPKGKTNSVEGEKSLPGGIDFEANSSGDSTYPSDITLETQNEIPSLLAADAFA